MGLRSFLGILPLRIPYPSVAVPAVTLSVPPKVTVLMNEEDGPTPAVHPGDPVKTGQDLARKGGKGPLICPVTGNILEIEAVPGPGGERRTAISIAATERDVLDPALPGGAEISKLSPVELRARIRRLGFSDLSAVASDPAAWPGAQTVLISALDLDPLGLANQQAFRDHSERLEECVGLLLKAAEAKECIVAVPGHLGSVASEKPIPATRVVRVPPFYPNGLPEILAAKYGVGGLLQGDRDGIMGNTLVIGFEQALAMLESVVTGKPLTEKSVTLSSDGDVTPRNFRVRLGTPLSHLLEKGGVKTEPRGKLILDGVLRGHACFSDEQPVTATTESIHVQSASRVFHFQNQACLNCGRCNAVCPVNLEANLIGRYSEYGLFDRCRRLVPENCIECGLCAYVCPAHRPLVQWITHAKRVLRTQAVEEMGLEEALACKACGPTCPAIKLFEVEPQENGSPRTKQE